MLYYKHMKERAFKHRKCIFHLFRTVQRFFFHLFILEKGTAKTTYYCNFFVCLYGFVVVVVLFLYNIKPCTDMYINI